jgi:protein O-mannosyl-transferase
MKKNKTPHTASFSLPLSSGPGKNLSHDIKIFALFLFAGLVAYFTAFDNEFTNWDDQGYVYENPLVTDFGLHQIKPIFTTLNIAGNYHPLTILSLGINHAAGNGEAWTFIIMNVLLHIVNTWLLYRIVMQLGGTSLAGIATGLMFLLHPLHVESVAWVSERKDVLYTLFWLLSWQSWIQWRKSADTGMYLLAMVFFILSCLSKGMAITLTGVYMLTDVFQSKNFKVLTQKSYWVYLILPFLISLVFGYVAILSQRSQGTIVESSQYSAIESILLASYGYMFYLWRMLIPYGLGAFYPYPAPAGTAFPTEVYVAPFAIVALLVLAWYSLRHSFAFVFTLAFYTGCISIVLQILPVGMAITADRYFYVASIGFCMGFGWLLQYIASHKGNTTAYASMGLIALTWTGLTARQADTWQNSITLFENVIRYHPRASVGYNNIGTILGIEKKDSEAIWYYRKAVEYNPRYSEAWNNMGILYKDLGNIDSALYCARKALELYPGYTNALSNLGNIYFTLKEYDLSAQQFLEVTRVKPGDPGGWLNLGAALQMKGRPDSAEWAYRKVLEINPNDYRALNNLGDASFNRNQFDEAIQLWQRVLAVKPDETEAVRKIKLAEDSKAGRVKDALTTYKEQIAANDNDAKAWLNAGTELFRQGKYKEAYPYFEKALKLDDTMPEGWNNFGTTHGILGDTKGAIRCFEKALALKPDYAEPMYNMGLAYGQKNDQQQALNYYRQAAKLGHAGAQKVLKDNGYNW